MKSSLVEAIWAVFFDVGSQSAGDGRASRHQLYSQLRADPLISSAISQQCLDAVDGPGDVGWTDLMQMLSCKHEDTPWRRPASSMPTDPPAIAPAETRSIVCFGEALVLKRHPSSPSCTPALQAPELITASAIAALGSRAAWVSVLPNGEEGQKVLEYAASRSVHTDHVVTASTGDVARAQRVGVTTGGPVYVQRARSAFATADPSMFRWMLCV